VVYRRRALSLLLVLPLAACLEFSPHELPRGSSDRDLHRKALEALSARSGDAPLRFAAVGDTQLEFNHAEDFVAAVNQRDDLDFVVQLGDFTNYGLTFEYEVMNGIFARLRVPYFVLAGNHDLLGNGQAIYEHMFGPRDLAFTHARVRVVLLDTNSHEHRYAPDVPDLAWLAEQLAPDPGHDDALVMGHCDPDAFEFNPELREPYLAVLRDAGVTLSLHAHAHHFASREHDGVTVVTADAVHGRSYVVVTAVPGGGLALERVPF
jgi:3',5'-cyclic AMP phosphodiesterase CpdA